MICCISPANRYAGNNKQKLITILYVTRRHSRPCSMPLINMVMLRKNFINWRSGNTLWWCFAAQNFPSCRMAPGKERYFAHGNRCGMNRNYRAGIFLIFLFRVRCKSDWGKFYIAFPTDFEHPLDLRLLPVYCVLTTCP